MADALNLRARRFNAGLTPEELGAAIGVSGRTIRRLEEGQAPQPGTAKAIADHFEVLPTDIWPIEDGAAA